MKPAFIKIAKRIIASVLILIAFIYITVFMILVPPSFNIRISDWSIISTYPISSIIRDTNETLWTVFFDKEPIIYMARPLAENLHRPFKNTISILVGGLLLSIVIGFIKGLIDSTKGERTNNSLQVLATVIPISFPDVLSVAVLQMFAVFLSRNGLKIVKVAGSGTINHMILPIIALSLLPAFYIARTLAVSIDNCYKQEYVKAALGKGCSKHRILWNHVLRNVTGIVFESLSNLTALIICNLVLIEYLFAYPGLTTWIMRAHFQANMRGAENNYMVWIIVTIIIGFIYFGLDIIFNIMKMLTYKAVREESA